MTERGEKAREWQHWQREVKRGGPEAVAYFVEKAIDNPALQESWRKASKRKPRKRLEREIAADMERLTEMANEWIREAKRQRAG